MREIEHYSGTDSEELAGRGVATVVGLLVCDTYSLMVVGPCTEKGEHILGREHSSRDFLSHNGIEVPIVTIGGGTQRLGCGGERLIETVVEVIYHAVHCISALLVCGSPFGTELDVLS